MLVALAIVLMVASGVLAFYRPGMGFVAGILLSVALVVCGAAIERMELVAVSPVVFFLCR